MMFFFLFVFECECVRPCVVSVAVNLLTGLMARSVSGGGLLRVVRLLAPVEGVRVRLVGLAASVRLAETFAAPEGQHHQSRHVNGRKQRRECADGPQTLSDARGAVCLRAPGL